MNAQNLKSGFIYGSVAAAYLCLPYSLPCMGIGALLYHAFGVGRDELSEDGGFWFTLGAPLFLPLLAHEFADRRTRPARERSAQADRLAEAAQFLNEELRLAGLPVAECRAEGTRLWLCAAVPPGQDGRFGACVAATARRFPGLPLATLCRGLQPLHALDRAWAERHGFADWAENVARACGRCGRVWRSQWAFGRARITAIRALPEEDTDLPPRPGSSKPRRLDGYVCQLCVQALLMEERAGSST